MPVCHSGESRNPGKTTNWTPAFAGVTNKSAYPKRLALPGASRTLASIPRMRSYLESSTYIDFDHPLVRAAAESLGRAAESRLALVRSCFEYVRDEVRHSLDYRQNPVTCRASDVLKYRTGYCYAKSHLLAALLRANGIPAGLCYQRLAVGDSAYCLHGLNAVFLDDFGWYRIDARGNKPGIDAQFCPPREALAFRVGGRHERDLPEIWPEPLPGVVAALEKYDDVFLVAQNLPDVDLWG